MNPAAYERKLTYIRALIGAGYTLIPLCPLTPHEHAGRPCKTPGKVPVSSQWNATAPGAHSPESLAACDAYGVLLGPTDLVVDIDPRNFAAGDAPVTRLSARIGAKLNSFAVRTGGGGFHIYLKKDAESLVRNELKEYRGVEFKSAGRQVVGPGSKHFSGKEYAVASGSPEHVADAPAALLALISRSPLTFNNAGTGTFVNDAATQGRFLHYLEYTAAPSIQGQQGDANAFKVAVVGRDMGLPPAITLELMLEVWNAKCQPPWAPDDLREKIANAYQYAKGAVGSKHPSAAFDAAPAPAVEEASAKRDGPPHAKDLPWNTTGQGKMLKTFNNLLNFMRAAEYGLGGVFAFNEFTGRYEFVNPAPWHRGKLPRVRSVGDDDLKLLKGYLATRCAYDAGVDTIEEAVTNVAYHDRFHPVRDYLTGLKWDGKPRLDAWLINYMGAEDTPFVRACAAKTLCAAVWRILEPGVKFDHVLILEGRQDLGKSTAIEILGRPWSCDAPIEPHSRDTVDLLQGRWIVELAELEVTRRTEEDALKAFITRKNDLARLAYGRNTREFPRQSIFIGTKNPRGDGTYLKDEENRRWWCVRCEPRHSMGQIDFDGLRGARDQLFAEALVRTRAMKHHKELSMHTLELKTAARSAAAERHTQHEWTEAIAAWLELIGSKPETAREFITSREIFREAMGGLDRGFDRKAQLAIGQVMKELGWEHKLKWVNARPVRGYVMPEPLAEEAPAEKKPLTVDDVVGML